MGQETRSPGGSLKAILSDSEGDLRLSDGKKGEGVAKKLSRLCLSLKDHESVSIGEDIKITAYRHTGKIRLIIQSPRKYAIARMPR